jgi:hypothetical protein
MSFYYKLVLALFTRWSPTVFLLFVIWLQPNGLLAGSTEEILDLKADNFEHIEFKRIKQSRYSFHEQQLQVDVEGSSSFLMKSFDRVSEVKKVSFKWRANGAPKIKDALHEEQKQGDDAVFKLGLLLEGNDSFSNPFVPAWVKRVDGLLKYPSEDMIYLVADSKHEPGQHWTNPYNKRVTMIAIESVNDTQGWQRSSYYFDVPVKVVGIWLMSDGDNTGSSFTANIKDIKLE